MGEPTFLEALVRIKKELAGTGAMIAVLGGGGWVGLNQQDNVEDKKVIQVYEADLGRLRMQIADQRKICLELVANERTNTEHWRALCGGTP